MTNNDDTLLESEQSFEDLLRHATPRPNPSAEDTAVVREAVREEWLKVATKRRTRTRFLALAAAASVVLTLTVVIDVLRVPTPAPVPVASIEKSIGSIYVLSDESRLQATGDLAFIVAGQTIVTGDDSALGLTWSGGGSLRVAADSRVLFTSVDGIELLSGQIYFDSMDGASELAIETRFGAVQHIGTQFMTSVDSDSLSVSVRDGRVAIAGVYFDPVAEEHQRITLRGSARAEVLSIAPFGRDWEWIEAMASANTFSGKTVYELLQWVAKETGVTITYESRVLEDELRTETLKGEVSGDPRKAFRQGMTMNDLHYESSFETGVLHITEREGG